MRDDSDDLIPEDDTPRLKVGRALEPAGSGRCMECPMHGARQAWCPVRAEPRAGRAPMCRYGRALVAARQTVEKKRHEQ